MPVDLIVPTYRSPMRDQAAGLERLGQIAGPAVDQTLEKYKQMRDQEGHREAILNRLKYVMLDDGAPPEKFGFDSKEQAVGRLNLLAKDVLNPKTPLNDAEGMVYDFLMAQGQNAQKMKADAQTRSLLKPQGLAAQPVADGSDELAKMVRAIPRTQPEGGGDATAGQALGGGATSQTTTLTKETMDASKYPDHSLAAGATFQPNVDTRNPGNAIDRIFRGLEDVGGRELADDYKAMLGNPDDQKGSPRFKSPEQVFDLAMQNAGKLREDKMKYQQQYGIAELKTRSSLQLGELRARSQSVGNNLKGQQLLWKMSEDRLAEAKTSDAEAHSLLSADPAQLAALGITKEEVPQRYAALQAHAQALKDDVKVAQEEIITHSPELAKAAGVSPAAGRIAKKGAPGLPTKNASGVYLLPKGNQAAAEAAWALLKKGDKFIGPDGVQRTK